MNNIIDLFSGVGGLSLGAARSGFTLAGAVELDKVACQAHRINFPSTKHLNTDISTLNGQTLKQELGIDDLCGLIGGPPCQGFSTIGKRDIKDPRNDLFLHFFRLVSEIKPKFFLAENVKGILHEKYSFILSEAYKLVEDLYQPFEPIVLNPKDYGGATSRPRVFFISFRKDVVTKKAFSIEPTLNQKSFKVSDALEGLNSDKLFTDKENSNDKAWSIISKNNSIYQSLISEMIEGVGDKYAIDMYKDKKVSGMVNTIHSKKVTDRYYKLKPGETDKVSRSTKLKLDGYCPTLRAGTGSDKGSFQAIRPIHPIHNRVITVREAARLQGFPDWFQFHKTKWHSFRLIGNSVNPILSAHILSKIKEVLPNE
ncbi:DNA cytosine methyltransferase [Bacillus sp. Marseille-P3800]|uniref:DNA cytosine methyltransferase n=1 Tax=Bacillus sp. Marseille-P3800 TaxID=2014782 RepID=UPI00159B9189|nr:DNA cytosine methyltransferase [Bacillus sp. Marseille-P3800]